MKKNKWSMRRRSHIDMNNTLSDTLFNVTLSLQSINTITRNNTKTKQESWAVYIKTKKEHYSLFYFSVTMRLNRKIVNIETIFYTY